MTREEHNRNAVRLLSEEYNSVDRDGKTMMMLRYFIKVYGDRFEWGIENPELFIDTEVFANIRPVQILEDLADASPIKPDRLEGVDLVVVRELTGGIYFGQPKSITELPDGDGFCPIQGRAEPQHQGIHEP